MKWTIEHTRRKTGRMLAGAAGGLADSLRVPDAYVRAAFITLLTVWGLGAFLYVGLWLVSFDRVEDREVEQVDPGRGFGLGLAFLGLLLLLGAVGLWPSAGLVLTAGALAFGTAALTDRSRPGPLAALMDPTVGRPSLARMIVGSLLLVVGASMFFASFGRASRFGDVLIAVALTGLGALVAFGPWVRRVAADLGAERQERIRQEERAEVAAHLHDSVLQTLALIQRSDDPSRMAILARRQEAELRDWLYGHAPLAGADLVSAALRNAALKVESDHQIPVDVVTVGDHPVDEASAALVGAATEAMVNAAKHSGAERMSLYFEAEEGRLAVYVTDQGSGFNPAAAVSEGRGIARSIRSRLEKAGGEVDIVSELGEGTEVAMSLPVSAG